MAARHLTLVVDCRPTLDCPSEQAIETRSPAFLELRGRSRLSDLTVRGAAAATTGLLWWSLLHGIVDLF